MATIQAEAERLNRFIGNLLDMTRLESGAIEIKPEPEDLAEIVGTALQRAGRLLAEHRVDVDLAPDLPMLRARLPAVRAGAVQPARQRREIRAAGLASAHRRATRARRRGRSR